MGDEDSRMTGGVSIAMCTYNGARFLGDQLESIATQRLPPDELVICDDGSTDETLQIVESFRDRCPFPIRISTNPRNLGSTKNFERAIGLCRFGIIFLADQDDVWLPAKTQRILEVFARSPDVKVLFTDAELVDESLRPRGHSLWEAVGLSAREVRAIREGGATRVLLKHNVATGATMAFRRELLDVVMPIPEVWIHDGWIAFVGAAVGAVECLEERLIMYRQHDRNQVGARKEDLLGEVAAARRVDRTAYLVAAQQYQAVLDRLRAGATAAQQGELIDALEAKIRHQRTRALMPQNPLRRLAVVLGELVCRRYHRYAGGYRSALKDLARL